MEKCTFKPKINYAPAVKTGKQRPSSAHPAQKNYQPKPAMKSVLLCESKPSNLQYSVRKLSSRRDHSGKRAHSKPLIQSTAKQASAATGTNGAKKHPILEKKEVVVSNRTHARKKSDFSKENVPLKIEDKSEARIEKLLTPVQLAKDYNTHQNSTDLIVQPPPKYMVKENIETDPDNSNSRKSRRTLALRRSSNKAKGTDN